jgi:hypothetical protein
MPRGWLLLLCLVLLIVEPVSLALAASGRLFDVVGHPDALAIIAVRVAVAGLGISAGLSLWTARPAGPFMAKVYLVAASALALFSYATPYGGVDLRPGLAGPLTAFLVIQNAMWFVYVSRARQVRDRQPRGGPALLHQPRM